MWVKQRRSPAIDIVSGYRTSLFHHEDRSCTCTCFAHHLISQAFFGVLGGDGCLQYIYSAKPDQVLCGRAGSAVPVEALREKLSRVELIEVCRGLCARPAPKSHTLNA